MHELFLRALRSKMVLLLQSVHIWSWRATVLQNLSPACLNTPIWKFLVCLVRYLLAGQVCLIVVGACRTVALQEQDGHPWKKKKKKKEKRKKKWVTLILYRTQCKIL